MTSTSEKKEECLGECFMQCGENLETYVKYADSKCKCELKECPNKPMCKRKVPEHVLLAHENTCDSCAIAFGGVIERKTYTEDVICPGCQNDVHLLMCICKNDHYICHICVRKVGKGIGHTDNPYKCPVCQYDT